MEPYLPVRLRPWKGEARGRAHREGLTGTSGRGGFVFSEEGEGGSRRGRPRDLKKGSSDRNGGRYGWRGKEECLILKCGKKKKKKKEP